MSELTHEEQERQEYYRDARFTKRYDGIWQSVGKCVFCDLKDKYIFFEENGVVMTVSLYAYIDGHLMIVPRRHIRSPKELTDSEWQTIRKFTYLAKKLIKEVHGARGMQLVQKDGAQAQSTVADHLHFHCIPFDAPDLLTWNYRKLKYTPLENAQAYRDARKTISQQSERFNHKYSHPTTLPVICDLLILNQQNEVLFQERQEWAKLTPDTYTLPGGHVEYFERGLEAELAREVQEETGLILDTSRIELVASRISTIKRVISYDPLDITYRRPVPMLWNSYLLRDFDKSIPLVAADDAKALHWIARDKIAGHSKVSDGIKELVAQVKW